MRKAVRALVFRGNDLLVMRRNKFGKVYYTLPGGGIKFGETPEQALGREMCEESSLQLGSARLVFIENAGLIYGMQYVYLMDYIAGEPHLDAGSDEAQVDALGQNRYHPEWLSIARLPEVPFVSNNLKQAILQALKTKFPERVVTIWHISKESMSMATVHERVFSWVAVAVVIVSAGALSAAFIIQQIMTNQATTPPPVQTAQTCADSNVEPTLGAPAKYVASNNVAKLQITDLSVGTGLAAKAGDCLVVKYYGTLASDGTLFDENYTKPEGFAFLLGQGQVIPGWDQGLLGMKVGGVRRLVIPAALAYGNSSTGTIPANSALVFDVKLLRIQ